MKNITKSDDGYYHVKGHKYELLIGSRAQVWHGTAYKTSGGLCKHHLFKNKHGRVVSKSKYESSKKEKRLLKYGYGFTKKKFVLQRKHSKKHRGGSGVKQPDMTMPPPPKTTTKGGTYGFSSGPNIVATAARWDHKWGNDQSPGDLQLVATNYSGGKSRRHKKHRKGSRKMKGGIYSQSSVGVADNVGSWNSKEWGSNKGPNLQLFATTHGGKRKGSRRKSHKKRGGYSGVSGNTVAADYTAAPFSQTNTTTQNSTTPQPHNQSTSANNSAAANHTPQTK
jgi:DVNP family